MSRVRREMKWNAEREIINRQRGDFVMKGKGWRYKLILAARRAKTFFPFAAVGERFPSSERATATAASFCY